MHLQLGRKEVRRMANGGTVSTYRLALARATSNALNQAYMQSQSSMSLSRAEEPISWRLQSMADRMHVEEVSTCQ